MTRRTCTEPGCDRLRYAGELCRGHWDRRERGSTLTGPISTEPVIVDGDVFMPCPDSLLDLAGACADNDAKAIVRLIWPHLLEAGFAGLHPFTLDEAS